MSELEARVAKAQYGRLTVPSCSGATRGALTRVLVPFKFLVLSDLLSCFQSKFPNSRCSLKKRSDYSRF